jgi:hypothetical protein
VQIKSLCEGVILSSIRCFPAVGLPYVPRNSPTNTVHAAFLAATVLPAASSLPYRHNTVLQPAPWEQPVYSWQSIGSGTHRYVKTLFVELQSQVARMWQWPSVRFSRQGYDLLRSAYGGLQASVPTLRHGKTSVAQRIVALYPDVSKQPTAFTFTHQAVPYWGMTDRTQGSITGSSKRFFCFPISRLAHTHGVKVAGRWSWPLTSY